MGASIQVRYAKIAILAQYLATGSMTAALRRTTAMVHGAVYHTDDDASVNLVYHSLQHGRQGRREQNRTKFNNCTQR